MLAVGVLLAIGAVLYLVTPHPQFDGHRPDTVTAVYGAWMALLAQPITSAPQPVHLTVLAAIYPVFGFLLIGEGVVRLALLLMSKRHGEKEWMRVMANTYRDHIVLCGLGHLGYRVFEELSAANVEIVIVEIDANNRFVAAARAQGACILIRDMKDDQALLEAGIERAHSIVVATNDDMANLEVAMDARRMNPNVRILLRLFEQKLAQKIAGAMTIDQAFSASALAAPIIAAMSLRTKILSTLVIGGVPHCISEVSIEASSTLIGKRVDELERGYSTRVLARRKADASLHSPPEPSTILSQGDQLTIHLATGQLTTISAAARGERVEPAAANNPATSNTSA